MLSALGHIGIEKDQSPEGKSFKEGSNPSCSNKIKRKEIAMKNYQNILLVSVLISSMVLILCSCERKNEKSGVSQNETETVSPVLDNDEYQNIVDEVALHHERYQREYAQFIEDNVVLLSSYQSAIENAYNEAENAVNILFDGYKDRIPAFAKEITSFTKTASLFLKSVQDIFMKDKTHVETQIMETFEKTVFDNDTLTAQVNTIIENFQAAIGAARETYWKNVASYLNRSTTFTPIDLKEIKAEVSFVGVSDLHNNLGKDIGETGVTAVAIGSAGLALLTVTTALPGIIDDAIAFAGMAGYAMLQGEKREQEIIENYTIELDSLRDAIVSGENGVGLISIFDEAMAGTSFESDTIIKAIKEGNV